MVQSRVLAGSARLTAAIPPVADQLSAASTAAFSYALPAIVSMTPQTARTLGDRNRPSVVTLVTRNLPLLDPLSRVVVSFGNAPYDMLMTPQVPTTAAGRAAATNPDGSLNVTFTLPAEGAGAQLAVSVVAVPTAVTSGTTGGTASAVTNASLFSYADPMIYEVVVTRARLLPATTVNVTRLDAGAIICPFPDDNSSVWQCADPNLVQIAINGDNFGADPGALMRPDGATRRVEMLQFVDPIFGTEYWTDTTIYPVSWSHTRVIVIAKVSAGTIRLSLASTGYGGAPMTQSVRRTFTNLSPGVAALSGATSNIPTTGGTLSNPLVMQVENLASATDLLITVGNVSCSVLNAAGTAVSSNVRADVITPGGPTTWTVRCVVPPGQGADVPVVVTRMEGSVASPSDGTSTIDYAPPVLTGVALQRLSALPAVAFDATTPFVGADPDRTVVTVPTQGLLVRLLGSNLGVMPTVLVGDGWVLEGSPAVRQCAGTSDHSCYEFAAPAGEGDGRQFVENAAYGFRLVLAAGNQQAAFARFRYELPAVTGVASAAGFPTRGGVLLAVTGGNFGASTPGRDAGESVVTVAFSRSGEVNATVLTCGNVTRCLLYTSDAADE